MGRLDHVGIAVASLERARRVYEALGLRCTAVEEVPGEGVRVALFPVGEARIELLEATDPEGAIARFIARRGEGIHHICLTVDDLDGALGEASARGLELVGGARVGEGGHRVAFLHPRSTHGVLIELREERGF